MTIPSFDLPVLDRRSPWCWALVLGLLFFLISLVTFVYLSQSKYDVMLRSYLSADDSERVFGSPAVTKETLKHAIVELRASASSPDSKALYAVSLRKALGEPPDRQDLQVLANSKNRRLRTVAEIYGPARITRSRAEKIADELDGGPFAYQIAVEYAYERAGLPSPTPKRAPTPEKTIAVAIAIVFLIAGGIAVWIVYSIGRAQGSISVSGISGAPLSLGDADRHAGRAGLMLLAYVLANLGALVLLDLPRLVIELIDMLMMVAVALAVVPNLLVAGKRLGLRKLGLAVQSFGVHFAWAICGVLAVYPLIFVTSILSGLIFRGMPVQQHPITIELGGTTTVWTVIAIFLMASVFAPIWEEITFRGYLFPALSTALRSPVWGILISSFAFAAIHPTGIPTWPILASIGSISAILYYHTGSLWPSIFFHSIYNTITLLFTLVLA